MIRICQGNILETQCDAIVSPVNTGGVAGAGLAKVIAERWQYAHKFYVRNCRSKSLRIGTVLVARTGEDGPPAYVVFFPTKAAWRLPSRHLYIKQGVSALVVTLQFREDIKSIAIPALGCGLGGLEFPDVREEIVNGFERSTVNVDLYPPQ